MRDTIELCKEAGYPLMVFDGVPYVSPELERLVAFVRADERSVEREACAKVCEAGVDYEHPTVKGHIMENFGHSRLLAKAIRARGNT